MREIHFTQIAFTQYNEWLSQDKKLYTRLTKLIFEVARTPFEGTGKPKHLKHDFKGFWSRRINDEHRLVYQVENDFILIVFCKNHY
jgi:toxin YoeB